MLSLYCFAVPLDIERLEVASFRGEARARDAASGRPVAPTAASPEKKVVRLTLLHDETVTSIARALHPRDPVARRALEQAIIAANPQLFPEGKALPLAAGTRLFLPELPRGEVQPRAARPEHRAQPRPVPARPPGPRAAEPEVFSRERLAALEQKIAQLRDAQIAIDRQLASLEQAVEGLRRSLVMLLDAVPLSVPPAPPVAPLPPTPAPERGMPWILWAGAATGALLLAIAAFFFGRRTQTKAVLAEHEARIDALLHEARQAAGPLLDIRARSAPPRPPTSPAPAPVPPRPQQPERPPSEPRLEEELAPPVFPDIPLEPPPPGAPAAGEPSPPEPPRAEQPGLELRQEMDLALDSARSMFTDVDRFIALGRIQNAISLLEFQIHRDPNDRDSWVKLMAVYRQEGMESEFQRTYAEFRRRFPDEV